MRLDKDLAQALLDAVAECIKVAAQPLPPDGVNPNMALVDAGNHIWRYHTAKRQIYLLFTDATFATVGNLGRLADGMTENQVVGSIRPRGKRKAPDGGKAGAGKKSRKTQGDSAPAPQVVPLPPMMAQENLTAEMARLEIKLPFYLPVVDPQPGQPLMEERWQAIRGFTACGLALLLRQDPRFQTALQDLVNPQHWENSLFTLAGQAARLRNTPTYGFTPITYNGVEHHHLALIAQERGLVIGNLNPLRHHDANSDFLETAHASGLYVQIETTGAGAAIGGMARARNHFLQLEPTDTPERWLLFDPLQRDANNNPYLLPVTAVQVRTDLSQDDAPVMTVSNALAPAQAPELDAVLDAEFLQHNPRAWSAVLQAPVAQQPLVHRGGHHGYAPPRFNDDAKFGYLRAAAPPSIAPVEDWRLPEKDVAAPTAEAVTHLVMQLEDDKTVVDMAFNLYRKHADAARLLQMDLTDGTAKEISPPSDAAAAEDLKALVVGHSRAEGVDASTTETLAGQPADALAATLAPTLQQWRPAQVNVVGCKTGAFVIRFAAALRRHGVMASVVGYDAWLKVDEDGHKRVKTNEAEAEPARTARVRIDPTDAIFEKIPEKDVATANRLRQELLPRTLDRRAPSFLETILAEAPQAFAQEHQILYFLEQCQDGVVFAGHGRLVYATKAELHLSGIDAGLLQRGDKVAYTPGMPPLAAKASLRQHPSRPPEAHSIPGRSETKGVKR